MTGLPLRGAITLLQNLLQAMIQKLLPLAALAAVTSPVLAQNKPLPKKLPAGLEATLFAAPPMVNYPTFVAAAANGELFVSVDKNGSLDAKPDRGFIYKLVDTDGDGKADKKTVFADKVVSARGLAVDGDTVYCLHPPELEAFRDKDGDGVAEERTVLIKGIGFDLAKRPPDHTSNGATLGIDGWLYLAIGDFGFMEAEGKDGHKLQLRGGGVVRVRTDGTEMELFCRGTRNIYGVAVDPWLNTFARDNTNDGGGWDTRVETYFYGCDLGYPRLFKNFTDETLPVLGIYGGGSGVGGVYVQEKGFGWPAGYDDCLYTCDWGRSAIYRHQVKDTGASFEITQDTFCELERVTDMTVDAAGRAYISSWKGANFTYNGEDVGYIVMVAPPARKGVRLPRPFEKMTIQELVTALEGESHRGRLAAQRELLRRADKASARPALEAVAADTKLSVPSRVAALFTLKQMLGIGANAFLQKAVGAAELREFALRALADRPAEGKDVPTAIFANALKDPDDHVKAQAIIGLSRLGRAEAAEQILMLAAAVRETGAQTLAVEPRGATGNVKKTSKERSAAIEADISGAKTLHLVVTDSGDGIGVDHADWMEPTLSGPGGTKRLTELKWKSATQSWGATNVNKNCLNQPLKVNGQPVAFGIGTHSISVISYDLPPGYAKFTARGGLDDSGCNQADMGSVQFQVYVNDVPPQFSGKASSAESIYTDATRTLPHIASRALMNLGAAEACLKALDSEPSKHAAALRVLRNLHTQEVVAALLSRLGAAKDPEQQRGLLTALIRLCHQEGAWTGDSWGTRPDTTGPYYKREAWSETPKIEKALTEFLNQATPEIKAHAANEMQRHRVQIKGLPMATAGTDPQWAKDQEVLAKAMQGMAKMKQGDIGTLEPHVVTERTLAALNGGKANVKKGERFFVSQGCAACHTTGKDDPPKGPNLHDIASRYKPEELITSILNPSQTVSQGFPTNVLKTKDGQLFSGFALRESGDEIVLRNMAAVTQVVPLAQVVERTKDEHVSSMTPGLVNNLTPEELADLLHYFRSLLK